MKLQERFDFMETEATIDKAEAVVEALEDALIDVVPMPESAKMAKKALNLVYVMMDMIYKVSDAVESLKDMEVSE